MPGNVALCLHNNLLQPEEGKVIEKPSFFFLDIQAYHLMSRDF